jgi:hypothetical protein
MGNGHIQRCNIGSRNGSGTQGTDGAAASTAAGTGARAITRASAACSGGRTNPGSPTHHANGAGAGARNHCEHWRAGYVCLGRL